MLCELVGLLAASEPLAPQASEMEHVLVNEKLSCAMSFVNPYGSTKRLEVCSGYHSMSSQGHGRENPRAPASSLWVQAQRPQVGPGGPEQRRAPQAWALCLVSSP